MKNIANHENMNRLNKTKNNKLFFMLTDFYRHWLNQFIGAKTY